MNVLVACSLALRLICIPEFRVFLAYLNSDINVWLPTSLTTIYSWVIRQFEDHKGDIKTRIQSARSKIHISCDLWTSPNSLAILGVTAHFVSKDKSFQHCTLTLKDIIRDYTNEHLQEAILEVLTD